MGDDGEDKPAASVSFLQTKGGIALFTGLLGLSGSLITATYTFVSSRTQIQFETQLKKRELALADLKEDHAIEKDYFMKAVDPGNSADLRSRILRYVTISGRVAPEMKDWARGELLHVDAELQVEAEAGENSVEDAKRALAETRSQISKLKSEKNEDASKTALADKEQRQEAMIGQLKLRASTSRVLASASRAAAQPEGRTCEAARVRALALGPDDPDQVTANAQCVSSTAGRVFTGERGGNAHWFVRREGRNFQCECVLQ